MAAMQKAIFAGGCFWCTEHECRAMPGVVAVRPGYIGGHADNPTYEQVCTGRTGHAEAIEIMFDPDRISYRDLVRLFLTEGHDPTQLNRQWVDVGTQYRSAIFYMDDAQKREAEAVIAALEAEKRFAAPIVTTLEPAGTFWPAEAYHHDYYRKYEAAHGAPHVRVTARH